MPTYRCPLCHRVVSQQPILSPTSGILCIDDGESHVFYERTYTDEPLAARPLLVGGEGEHRVKRPEV